MTEIIKVVELEYLKDFDLRVRFSNGSHGVADFSWIKSAKGSMVAPLKETDFFAKAFLSMGVPTWPNGFDVDAINLHNEMEKQGRLQKSAA